MPSHRGVRAEGSARATNLLAVLPNTCAVISPQAHHTVLPRRSLNNVPSHRCFRAEECAQATNLLAVPPDTCAVISPQAHRTVLPTRSLNKQPPHCKPTMQQQPPHCKPTMLPQQTTTSLQTYDAPSTTHPSPLLLLNKLLPYVRKFALPLRSQIRTAPTTTPTFPHHSCTSPHLHQLVPSHFTPLISHRLQQKRRTRRTPIPKPPLSAPHTPQTHFSSTSPCLLQLVLSRFPPPSAAEPLTSHAHSELPPPTSAHTTDTTYQHAPTHTAL